jgi:uncharacterized membrane protein (DUF106 family)
MVFIFKMIIKMAINIANNFDIDNIKMKDKQDDVVFRIQQTRYKILKNIFKALLSEIIIIIYFFFLYSISRQD